MYKNILIVETANGGSTEVTAKLDDLGFEIIKSSNSEEALKIIKENTKLILIVIYDLKQSEHSLLIDEIKKNNSKQTVLLITDKSSNIDDNLPADLILDIDADDLFDQIEQILLYHFYPETIVKMVCERTQKVLEENFYCKISQGKPYLKGNCGTLAPISAILSFVGPKVSGKMVVSGYEEFFADIFAKLVPGREVSTKEAEDLAGEMGNLFLGRIKEFFVRFGYSMQMTAPLFLRGGNVAVRHQTQFPSMVVPFQDKQMLYLLFCFDNFESDITEFELDNEKDTDEDFLVDGEITFI